MRESLRAHGQRTPIEVVALTGALPYGLLSGWRRLAALKALLAETGDPRFATVQALVRRPETAADAYVAMVEENEIRLGLSQYERARVAARAAARGVFEDEEAALRALFATASRPKRSRIRAFVALYHGLDAALSFPAAIPERLGLALVERLREGRRPGDRRGAGQGAPRRPPRPSSRSSTGWPARRPRRGRASPAARPLAPGLALETRLEAGRLTLTLKGRAVDAALAARVEAALAAALAGAGRGLTKNERKSISIRWPELHADARNCRLSPASAAERPSRRRPASAARRPARPAPRRRTACRAAAGRGSPRAARTGP